MMLTKCYYVVYHVADFAADNEFICHQDAYRDHNNALLVAKDLAKCLDVADNVFVIDGLTGEVLNTILKDAPQEDKAEEDDAPADDTPTSADTYRDKNGDTWFRISDGRWRIDCSNRHCADCPYYSEEGDCIVQEPLHDADRNYQVELARQKKKIPSPQMNFMTEQTVCGDSLMLMNGTTTAQACFALIVRTMMTSGFALCITLLPEKSEIFRLSPQRRE